MIDVNLLKSIDRNRLVIAHAAGRKSEFYIEQLGKLDIFPVCFSDRDTRKHYTQVCGKMILPVEEAMQKYPNAYFYITSDISNMENIAEYLISNYDIKREDILNFIIHKKKISCRFINGDLNIIMTIGDKSLRPCCMFPNMPFKTKIRENDIDGTIADYLQQCENALQIINSGAERDFCINCPHLVEQYDDNFDSIKFSTILCYFNGLCNFECIYCDRSNKYFNAERANDDHKYLQAILISLEKIGAINNTTSLGFANDEITINPFQNEFFEVAKKYLNIIFTNASVYSENIVKAAKNKENFHIIVSNDSGTKETFKKIKKRDVYDKVCDNLQKYASSGVKIHMKYIFIPGINDNIMDIDGFVSFCGQINPEVVAIDKERQVYEKDFSTSTIELIRNMFEKLSKLNIQCALGYNLTIRDKKAISEFYYG